MKTLQIAYRDVDRTPLLYVLKHMAATYEDLDLRLDHIFDGNEYEQGFLDGEIEIICEHSRFLPAARLQGYPVRFLASCTNLRTDNFLTTTDIQSMDALQGKCVAIRSTPSSCLSAKSWINYLGLDDVVSTIEVDDDEYGRWRQWEKVVEGDASAVICSPLYAEPALEAGLHALDVPGLPEVGPLFLAALGTFVTKNDESFRSLIRALYRALHVFHELPALAIEIISKEPAELMHLLDEAAILECYKNLARGYDKQPIPSIDTLRNTFRSLNEDYENLDGLNFLTLWDLRYVIELEESGFMNELHGEASTK